MTQQDFDATPDISAKEVWNLAREAIGPNPFLAIPRAAILFWGAALMVNLSLANVALTAGRAWLESRNEKRSKR